LIVPELTYQFRTAVDTAGGAIDIVMRDAINSGTVTSVVTDIFTVPTSKIFVFTAGNVQGNAGAGQVANLVAFQIHPIASELGRVLFVRVRTPALVQEANFSGQLWMPPGSKLSGVATFDSGVNSNSVSVGIVGVLIPRANVHEH